MVYVMHFETPTKLAWSLGRFSDETEKEHEGEVNSWARTCVMGVGRNTLEHNGDVRAQGGTQPSSLTTDNKDLGCVWESLG
jgi:hypothetical protein